MTDVIGPFDNSSWSQDAWYRHAPKWAPSGVNGSPAADTSSGDLPLSLSGLNFTIGIGRAWVRGAGFERSGTPASQPIAANTNLSLSRRDRVVLRRDLAAKTLGPVLIQGTPSSSPTAPSLQQVETGQWDLPLFSFLVPPNSGTAITGVIDERAWIRSSSDSVCFLTTAGRAAYFSAPNDGDTCIVGGYQHVYQGGAWHGTTTIPYSDTTADGTIYTTTHDVMSVAVADPGFPYRVHATGAVLIAVLGSGITVAARIRVNGSPLNPLGPNVGPGATSNVEAFTWGSALSGSLTGASTVSLSVEVLVANAGFGFQAATSAAQNHLSVLVVPA